MKKDKKIKIKNIHAVELGKRGGLQTLKNKGKKHFSDIAKEFWKRKKAENIN